MTSLSRLFDLRTVGRIWNHEESRLPNQIRTPSGEMLSGMSLPNSSLCADFLIAPAEIWAGVAVGIASDDLPAITELFQLAVSPLVKIVTPQEAADIYRYKEYPGWGWLEVLWSPAENCELVEVQTNGVVWYEIAGRTNDRRVVVLGLEDLASLAAEADRPLLFPEDLQS